MFGVKTIHTLVGTSKSGKSYLLKSMLTDMLRHGAFKFGLVFTATKFDSSYEWLPDDKVFADFDMDILNNWLSFLVRIKRSGKPIPPSFIVFDDIISSLPQGTKQWRQFISTFRHYNLTLFFTTQFPNMMDPLLRSQTEHAYLFQQSNDSQFKSSYASFGGLLPNLKAWKTYLNKHTGDYYCVIWNRDAPPILAQRYKRYKAPESKRVIKFEF